MTEPGSRSDRRRISRRQFMELLVAAGLGSTLAACGADPPPTALAPAASGPTNQAREPTAMPETDAPTAALQTTPASEAAYLSVARGEDPAEITRLALAAIGGIERFVKPGNDVIIKPNICHDYHSYEYGTTTNPEVVGTLAELCLGAGAKRVRVMDQPFGGPVRSAYAKSGIADAVAAAGGEMEVMHVAKYLDTEIPEGRDITEWRVFQDVLTTDVLINAPIAKHHGSARLSLGCKNLIGVVQFPNRLHLNLHQRIADLTSLVRPTLTVVDGVRTLMRNGPTGGNLDDLRLANTVIASHDIVAADAYAATLHDLKGEDIKYIRLAAEMGLGTLDLEAIKIEEVSV